MEIVTGYVGEPHVTSMQDQAQNQGIFGADSYVLSVGRKLAAELQSNNEIRIRDGVLVHQGCTGVVKTNTYDPVTITNGTQGVKRIDLIVARYTKNAETLKENLSWIVIKGTPAASNPTVPSYTDGDIQAGDLVADMPMYEVHLDGITVTEVKALFEIISGISKIQSEVAALSSAISKKQDKFYARQLVKTFKNGGLLQLGFAETEQTSRPTVVVANPCSARNIIISYDYDSSSELIALRAYNVDTGTTYDGVLRFSMIIIP